MELSELKPGDKVFVYSPDQGKPPRVGTVIGASNDDVLLKYYGRFRGGRTHMGLFIIPVEHESEIARLEYAHRFRSITMEGWRAMSADKLEAIAKIIDGQ